MDTSNITSSLPSTTHSTPNALAHALRDYACPEYGENISLLAFNRYLPDETFWWICPVSDEPAYRYGKFVTKKSELSGELFAGICFEKGVGPSISDLFNTTRVAKSWIVRRDWIWNPFFASLKDGTFDTFVAIAQQAAERPVDIIVSVATMSPPKLEKNDEEARKALALLPKQTIQYSFDSSRLTLARERFDADKLIPATSECHSLSDLATKLEVVKQIDWMWVNIEIGFLLSVNTEGDPVWHTDTIWENACRPFLEWFR